MNHLLFKFSSLSVMPCVWIESKGLVCIYDSVKSRDTLCMCFFIRVKFTRVLLGTAVSSRSLFSFYVSMTRIITNKPIS